MCQCSQRLRGHDFKNIFTKTKKLSRPGLPVHMGPRYSFLITNKYRKQVIKVSINKPRRQVQHFYKSGDGGTFFKSALSGERTHLIKFSIPSYTIFIRSSFVSPLFSNIADSNPLLLSLSLSECVKRNQSDCPNSAERKNSRDPGIEFRHHHTKILPQPNLRLKGTV